MPLIVEDGTGLANSNSYVSLAQAATYFADRGVTAWDDLDDDLKTPALINAAAYLRRTYGTLWAGYRSNNTQRMDWPRYGVPKPLARQYYGYNDPNPGFYLYNVIPEEIKDVQCDLALKISQGTELDPDLSPPVIEETVGPITVKYADGARQSTVFQAIENALLPFLISRNQFAIIRG